MTDSMLGSDEREGLEMQIEAARALGRLAHAMVGHVANDAELREITESADRLAAAIEQEPRRDRSLEIQSSPRFAAALAGSSLSRIIPEGALVDLFQDSPVSGSANPFGMGLRIRRAGDEAIGSVSLAPGWEGAPGRGHGGIVAALIDETIGGLLPIIGTMAFTGELTLRYRQPCPMGVPLEFRARLAGRDGRKLHIECVGTGPDGVFVESSSVFIAVDMERLAGLNTASPDPAQAGNRSTS